eukprot:CAMPEP_0118927138 /NCGR_PEP_ID=MMETSP1169-20130426/4678_1 /TAXON_ID=36882 /ORGANISM="Pyramimonas obovata, Strain CCMP722" /LENGTH=98 /DNA_ID=CAMNT_0006868841 /DNA_START=268 /DNA_END=560 /DNA_ORIENTATION=+
MSSPQLAASVGPGLLSGTLLLATCCHLSRSLSDEQLARSSPAPSNPAALPDPWVPRHGNTPLFPTGRPSDRRSSGANAALVTARTKEPVSAPAKKLSP